ncbi:MAG: TIR domain-containing protein, partial [Planctomycetes bacterium]|nr:TIR domain-containing protein [Planctomycetota bacterium]
MSNVFISYSRKDSEAVQRIHDALIEKGKNPWIDSEMPKSVDFLDEIYQAIESSDCFLVAISPDSASSEVCDLELKRALLHRKRIIPVVLSDVPARELPHEVSQLNWIFLRDDSDFAAGIDEIVKAIDTNPVWARTHTRLLTRAVLWEKNGNDRSRLLRGGDLIEAERQLGLVREEDSPRPTALQRQFMAASRKAYSQFWRTVLMCVSTALVAVVGLAIYSWFLKGQAEDQADRYARSTFSLQLGRVQGEVEERKYAEALKLLGDADRCPEHLRSFMWSYYLDQCQRQRALLSGHGAAVNCLSLSPDGKQIASSSDDHTIRLWKVSDWNSTVTLKGHQDEIWAVSFVPTQTSRQASKQIVSGSRDGVVLLWDLDQPDK